MNVTATERLLDARPVLAIERGYRAVQKLRRGRKRARARPQELVNRALDRRGSPADVVAALEAARDAGASGIASQLAQMAEPELRSLDRPMRARLVATLIEHRIAAGDRAGARALAGEHMDLLQTSARGATLLDLLEMRRELVPWLPGGRANSYALARAIAKGELDGERLLAIFARRPWVWLQTSEAHLLACNAFIASEPDRAARFLSRFLHRHDLPACHLDSAGSHILARMRFAATAPTREGPLVSIIVSAFNAAGTIEYAIDSLLGQTYRDIEILVADDASVDDTLDILRRRYGDHERVRLFRSLANQGTYNLRNALLERARGAYVTFHDADDLALPTRIEQQVGALRAADAVACTTNVIRMTANGTIVFFRDQAAARLGIVSLMMKRAAYDDVGPYRPVRFGADLELYEDLRARHAPARVVRLRAPLIFALWSERSLTRASRGETLEDGYRAPRRRVYSELVFRKHLSGPLRASEDEITAALADADIAAAPSPVEEVTS